MRPNMAKYASAISWKWPKKIVKQNSPLLSGEVTFPDFSKIEGQRLCLWLAHSLVSSELAAAAIAVDQSQDTDSGPQFWKSLEKWPPLKVTGYFKT